MRCLPKLCAQYALSFILTSNNTSSTALRSPFPSRGRLKKASLVRVILSERMRVEALRSAGGAKPRNEVTKGSSKDYCQPILLLLFATKERDPSTTLRMTEMSCFEALTIAKQLPNCSHSPSPDSVGSFSLRLGHLRGKTVINCFLTLSGRFATSRREP